MSQNSHNLKKHPRSGIVFNPEPRDTKTSQQEAKKNMHEHEHESLQHGAHKTSSYTARPPSPPNLFVHINPPSVHCNGKVFEATIFPSLKYIDQYDLTPDDMRIIAGGVSPITAIVGDYDNQWNYERRRVAQRILDWMWLGPTSAIRDLEWARAQSFTMMLVISEGNMNFKPMSVERAREELGIEVQYVAPTGWQDLIRMFPDIIRMVNSHLLAVHHRNLGNSTAPRRGKVLVTCNTGNEKAGVVVAAYIMAVLGQDFSSAIRLVNTQRFCCSFPQDVIRLLRNWEDIMDARMTVTGYAAAADGKAKRSLDDTVDMEEDHEMDADRFLGRESYVPFVDGEAP